MRRWRAAADGAVAGPALLAEADRLAGEIAQHVWLLHGGAPWADAPSEGGVLMLQELALGMLVPRMVTTSAALRYLSALEHTAATSDYEDVQAVRQELAWVRNRFAARFGEALREDASGAASGGAAARHERLRKELAAAMGERLVMAISAA